jgi:hypothetical protein
LKAGTVNLKSAAPWELLKTRFMSMTWR